jgi:aspartyl-tRNA(Asn)/glutamyl-tRNA(Gln) amidotransferase subunit A
MHMHESILFDGAASIAERVGRGEVSAREVAGHFVDHIEATDGAYGAFVTVDREATLAEAHRVDARIAAGEPAGPLAGVPVAIKDQIVTKGLSTTCASRILRGFVPPYDATVVARLRAAGAVIVGKTNQDEFAMGSSTENSSLGPCRNPWDPQRIPGGSSGGSAVAVALGQATASLGTDTGGSIRQPASLTGTYGLKPTYGRVSRYGAVAFASSLDQIGPFARSVDDLARMLQVIGGKDPLDSTSVDRPLDDFVAEAARGADGLRGLKVGVPKEYFIEGIDPGVAASVRAAIGRLEAAGAELVEVSLPHTEYCVATYYVIATAEASSNLARYDGVRFGHRSREGRAGQDIREMYKLSRSEGFGPEVKRRIMLGTYVLSSGYYDAYYLKAQKVRTLIRRDFDRAFEHVDLIATPTSPTVACRIGEKIEDPLQMYLMDIFTISCNLAGLPGASIPCGFVDGLPVGLQLLGRPFDEATLLRAARAHELAFTEAGRRPEIITSGREG